MRALSVLAAGLAAGTLAGCSADNAKRQLAEMKVENLTRCLEARGLRNVHGRRELEVVAHKGVRVLASSGVSRPPAVVSFLVRTARGNRQVYAIWRVSPRPEFRHLVTQPEEYPFVGLAQPGSVVERKTTEDCVG
jgi:hypothetical protein